MIKIKIGKITLLAALGIIIVFSIIFNITKLLSGLDVVGNQSLVSFKALVYELNDNITFDENLQSWVLEAPDNSVYKCRTKSRKD